ncbi:hypothetical protein FEM08_10000 [Flavobacterium gilvum]|nr:hypothetical protein FEM08_10000 [Flavobacterium gilvum]
MIIQRIGLLFSEKFINVNLRYKYNEILDLGLCLDKNWFF